MQQTIEIMPPEIGDLRLPPGLQMPSNVVLDESEAAAFLREPVARLRRRRLSGTGPVFVAHPEEPWAARYLVWDLLAWVLRHRHIRPPRAARSPHRSIPRTA